MSQDQINFETTWGRVKCHDGEHVWFPRFFGEGIASQIDGRKTFVTLTFEEPNPDAQKELLEECVEYMTHRRNCRSVYVEGRCTCGLDEVRKKLKAARGGDE